MRAGLLLLALTLATIIWVTNGYPWPHPIKKQFIPSKYAIANHWYQMAKDKSSRGLMCIGCTILVEGLRIMLEQNATEVELEEFVKETCVTLGLEEPYVCDHIVQMFGDEIFFVLERVIFTPSEICGLFIDDCGVSINPLNYLWNLTIPGPKPAVKPWPDVSPYNPKLRVLHLSDIHIDRHYEIGSEAVCEQDHPAYKFCCLTLPDYTDPIRVPAGKWGMPYQCDIPYQTFESAMRHISQTEKLDYIIVTGDMEAHNIWDYTKEDAKVNIANISATIHNFFPNTPVYESVGNHEGVPMDAMASHNMEEYDKRGPQWLYDSLAVNWIRDLPESAVEGIKYRASYAVEPYPGLKIISINSVYCSIMNLYNYIHQEDPDETLAWLVQELLASEKKKQKVHIISHIPPGDSYCLSGWSHNFYKIVDRFENTIAAQFYGHTHQDHFQVYYENGDPDGRPFQLNYIAPSLTTYDYNNPAYRIYTIDGNYLGSSFTVVDTDTYATDVLTANNEDKEPVWFHTYSAKKDYNMPDLSPQSWNDLIKRLESDETLYGQFMWNYHRSNHAENNCDATCKKERICNLRSAMSYNDEVFCPV